MKSLLRNIFTACIFLICTSSVHATLIDHGTYTTDDVSGLDWLDVTTTVNQSFNYVSSQFGAGSLYEGYRHATVDEVAQLVSNAGTTNIVSSNDRVILSETNGQSAADILNWLLGSTLDSQYLTFYGQTFDSFWGCNEGECWDVVIGYTSDVAPNILNAVYLVEISDFDRSPSAPSQHADTYDGGQIGPTTISSSIFGSYLVRNTQVQTSVPEPSVLALFGFGLFAMGFTRKKLIQQGINRPPSAPS